MRAGVCLVLTLFFVGAISCSTEVNNVQQATNIKKLIEQFNAISSESIKNIRKDKKGTAFFRLKNARGKISPDKRNCTVQLDYKMSKSNFYKIAAYASFFLRALYPGISSGTLNSINSKMRDGKYQYGEKYTYKNVKINCKVQLLNDGRYQYVYQLIIPHEVIVKE